MLHLNVKLRDIHFSHGPGNDRPVLWRTCLHAHVEVFQRVKRWVWTECNHQRHVRTVPGPVCECGAERALTHRTCSPRKHPNTGSCKVSGVPRRMHRKPSGRTLTPIHPALIETGPGHRSDSDHCAVRATRQSVCEGVRVACVCVCVCVCVSVCVKATTSRPQCSSVSTLPSHRRLNVTSALELEFSPIVEAREPHTAAHRRTQPGDAGRCSQHKEKEGGSVSSNQHRALTWTVQV